MALLLYNIYGDNSLLVFNGTLLNNDNALLAFNWSSDDEEEDIASW